MTLVGKVVTSVTDWNRPIEAFPDPVGGSYTLPPRVTVLEETVVTAPPPAPVSWVPSPFDLGPWGFDPSMPPVSTPFVTLIESGGEVATGSPLPQNVINAFTPYFGNFNLYQIRTWQGIPWYVVGNPSAYTSNNNIFFAPSAYNTTTALGIALIGHEVLHGQQYQVYGTAECRLRYVGEYVAGRLSGLGHQKAYEHISFERDAYALQRRIEEDLLRQGYSR